MANNGNRSDGEVDSIMVDVAIAMGVAAGMGPGMATVPLMA